MGALKTTVEVGSAQQIPHSIIYTYSSIEALADYVLGLSNGSSPLCFSVETNAREIENMIRKYEFSKVTMPSCRLPRSTTVLITGSTGNLGSKALEGLLQDDRILKIYTLNRRSTRGGQSILERHIDRFRDQGLDEVLLRDPRITHLETDMSEEKLGLSESIYCEVCVF